MLGNAFKNLGGGFKGIIGGMVLGIFLLPLGVYMQYCSANQMPYHKEFKKAIEVKSPADVKEDAVMIKTQGAYSLSSGPYSGIKTPLGQAFSGTFISYEVSRYIVKYERIEKKDDKGNVTGYEDKYTWEKEQTLGSSDAGLSVTVNSFTVPFDNFSQNYIPGDTKHFKYGFTGVIGGEQDSYPKSATVTDYNGKNYAIVISGKVFNPNDKDMAVTGIATNGSNTLTPKLKKVAMSLPQSLLAITYGNFTELYTSLESQSKTEGIAKFIIGSICFMLGFCGLFGPLLKLLNFIPVLGRMAIGVIYLVLAIVSIVLSFLFYIFFQFFWIIVALIIIIPIVLIIMNAMKKKKTAAA